MVVIDTINKEPYHNHVSNYDEVLYLITYVLTGGVSPLMTLINFWDKDTTSIAYFLYLTCRTIIVFDSFSVSHKGWMVMML